MKNSFLNQEEEHNIERKLKEELQEKGEFLKKEMEKGKADYEKQCMSEEQVKSMRMKMEEAKLEKRREQRKRRTMKAAAAAASIAAAFVILPNTSATVAYAMQQIPLIGNLVEVVTVRDYQYEDRRNRADIHVAEIKIDSSMDSNKPEENSEDAAKEQTAGMEEKKSEEYAGDNAAENGKENVKKKEEAADTRKKLQKTADEINTEIQTITDQLIEEFEKNRMSEEGYQDLIVKSELLATTEDYFTLKLLCYQGAGSGYQWNYFYTIDLNTGERLQLKDLFRDGADYISPISENIISQMKAQMEEDSMKCYWLDSEFDEWNFKRISEDTSFYVNEKGNVVVCFNEGDVAPMYMGTVEFEIPNEVIASIRKK